MTSWSKCFQPALLFGGRPLLFGAAGVAEVMVGDVDVGIDAGTVAGAEVSCLIWMAGVSFVSSTVSVGSVGSATSTLLI